GNGLRRVAADIVRGDFARLRVCDVVAVVDRGPHRTVGRDRQTRPVAHAGRERLSGPAAGRDPHDRGARRVRRAVVGGDVARRADGEVHRAVRADGDTLQRVGVRAAQIGTPGVRQAGRHGAAVSRYAVGVVVGVNLIALGDVERVARERQTVWLI